MNQAESERLEEHDGGQPAQRRRQGDRHHSPRHGRRRGHWFRGALQAIWYVLLAAAVSAVYHLLLAT